jgi:predicted metalloprotease with PDZ domain
MRSRFIKFSVVVVSIAAAAFADDGQKCNTPPEECARTIRKMMAGKPYLGAEIGELPSGIGLFVKTIVPDSPAERGDLKAGDRLIAVNGHRTTEASIKDFKSIVAEVGRTHRHIWMLVQRHGALKKIDVMMEPLTKAQIERIVAQHLAEAHSIASAVPDSRP